MSPPHRWGPTCSPPKGLVRPVRADPEGREGPTRAQVRSRAWRKSSYGFYVPTSVDGTVAEQRIMEQSVRVPEGKAVTGWASLRLHQATFFDGLERDGRTLIPVPLTVGPDACISKDDSISLSRERLDPAEVVDRYGVPCTVVPRALFDEMRRTDDLRDSVVAMDMTAAALLVSIRQMREYAAGHAGWVRIKQVLRALGLADERSRSPNETRMRLIWMLDACLPKPLVNQEIFDRKGRLVCVADLLDPVAGVVGEYDGAEHRGALRHSRDVRREEACRGLGLEYFKVTGPDMRSRSLIVSRMLSTRSRARWLSEDQRPWTIQPSTGWPREQTLDEYLEEQAWRLAVHRQYEREGTPDLQDLIRM